MPTKNNNSLAPTTMVIFGVSGDLSQRKLLPALMDLYFQKRLPTHFNIVGVSRQDWNKATFHNFVKIAIQRRRRYPASAVQQFIRRCHFQHGAPDQATTYIELKKIISQLDPSSKECANRLFYLAVPPTLYEIIFRHLADSGLSKRCAGTNEAVPAIRRGGWARLLVEKPFGRDIETAQALEKLANQLFEPDQIFQIDHYLAKETIQNILLFRFGNALFEPIWNNRHISKVELRLFETLGVEKRGDFYDAVGALRDVGQNHLLQMLSAIAMEHPGSLLTEHIRQKRTMVLEHLRPIKGGDIDQQVIRGQYQGYTREPGVKRNSTTETYFKIETYVDNPRWTGVPFYLESGKKMKEAKVEIKIHFKAEAACLMIPGHQHDCANVLTINIQPNEGISLLFWAKKPGLTLELEEKDLSFSYHDTKERKLLPDAYEQVLFDCIAGDQMRFLSNPELQAAWRFITPIIEGWDKLPLYKYAQKSWGPTIKNHLLNSN